VGEILEDVEGAGKAEAAPSDCPCDTSGDALDDASASQLTVGSLK